MALEALVSNDLSTAHHNLSASQHHHQHSQHPKSLFENNSIHAIHSPHFDTLRPFNLNCNWPTTAHLMGSFAASESTEWRSSSSVQGRKKRRRPRIFKKKEDAETQRMTHIAVERNRRKLMNEHLAVLRSLMPDFYLQRGDQASIVGGAIDFVKELEQHLQSLEVQKRILQQQRGGKEETKANNDSSNKNNNNNDLVVPPFAQFFSYPQYSWCQFPKEHPIEHCRQRAVADIEATMIETHANLRILSRKRYRQLIKMVEGFQSLCLTVLHLNVTTLDSFVLYSFSVKVEEGCHLSSADDIAGAVHHLLTIIEEEALLC